MQILNLVAAVKIVGLTRDGTTLHPDEAAAGHAGGWLGGLGLTTLQVTGINLAKDIDKAVIDLIKKDVSFSV